MKESAKYAKIVEWSERDHCFVGSCPGLIYGGCHGEEGKAGSLIFLQEKTGSCRL